MIRACVMLILFWTILVSLEVQANTLVIVDRTGDASIIAADSKLHGIGAIDPEPVCKIHVADGLIWTATGATRQAQGPLDVWKIVSSAITRGDGLDEIGSRIGNDVRAALAEMLPRVKAIDPSIYERMNTNGHVADVILIKTTEVRVVDFFVPIKGIPENIQAIVYSCPGRLCPNGHLRLFAGIYEAAHSASTDKLWQEKGFVGAANYLMDVQHQATPDLVAGPVSILKIEKSGGLQWLQNGNCH